MTNISMDKVALAKNGNKEAFGELYAELWQDLYRYSLYFLGNKEDAADAVQETAMAAYKSMPALRSTESFRAWIFAIAATNCKRMLSGVIDKRKTSPIEDLLGIGVDDKTRETDEAIELTQEIGGLKADEKTIILLSVVGGYNSREIAKMLKKPEGTVRSKMSRALQKLREKMTREE